MSKLTQSYPKHAYPSLRAFKAQKRKDLRAVEKAVNEFRMGCAYTPDGESTNQLFEAVAKLKNSLCQKT